METLATLQDISFGTSEFTDLLSEIQLEQEHLGPLAGWNDILAFTNGSEFRERLQAYYDRVTSEGKTAAATKKEIQTGLSTVRPVSVSCKNGKLSYFQPDDKDFWNDLNKRYAKLRKDIWQNSELTATSHRLLTYLDGRVRGEKSRTLTLTYEYISKDCLNVGLTAVKDSFRQLRKFGFVKTIKKGFKLNGISVPSVIEIYPDKTT